MNLALSMFKRQELPVPIPGTYCGKCGATIWAFEVVNMYEAALICMTCNNITKPLDIIVRMNP